LKIIWGLENATHDPRTIVTLGSYDGVHLGHREIIQRLCTKKRELGLSRAVLLTFHPHPQQVLRRHNSSVALLTTMDERLKLLATTGIDEVIIIEFTEQFSKTSYLDFFRDTIVTRLGTKAMVVGFNHAFGKDRQGDAMRLKSLAPQLGVDVEEVPPLIVDGISVSSTKIRHALEDGKLPEAAGLLGRNYSFSGVVVRGEQLGRTIGYPTANLEIPVGKLIPADGVYAVTVGLDGVSYNGALSIGNRPTVVDGGKQTVEVYLLDFEGDLYSKELAVECVAYIRAQETLNGLDRLKAKIAEDVARVRILLS
jgi:riboflavin kinase/FMN adenylyltransferase